MDAMDYGKKLFSEGNNCCQSVIMAVCEKYGLSQEQAYRLAAFFGGGMRCKEVCGAVSGALMGYGLIYGDADNRQCNKSKEFLADFQETFGSILCRDLTEVNGKTRCPEFIAYCIKRLEDESK